VVLSVLATLRFVRRAPPVVPMRFITVPETIEARNLTTAETLRIVSGDTYHLALPAQLSLGGFGFRDTIIAIRSPAPSEYRVRLHKVLVQVTFHAPGGTTIALPDGSRARAVESMPFGVHRIICRHPEYYDLDTSLQVSNARPLDCSCRLVRRIIEREPETKVPVTGKPVKVKFISDHRIEGATVLIDGEPRGTVPCFVSLKRGGRHTAVLRLTDGRTGSRRLVEVQKAEGPTEVHYFAKDFDFK